MFELLSAIESFVDAFPELVVVPFLMENSVNDRAVFEGLVLGTTVVDFSVEYQRRSERHFGFGQF